VITPLLVAALHGASLQQPPLDRWFAEDKLKHFAASFFITSVSASAARFAGIDRHTSVVIGVGVGAAAGLAKELSDARPASPGTFSYRDIIWDIAGIAAATAVVDASR
jgi:uncharacterized protein YfiM (DUF2279 family)